MTKWALHCAAKCTAVLVQCSTVYSAVGFFIGVEQMTGGQDETHQEVPTPTHPNPPGQRVHSLTAMFPAYNIVSYTVQSESCGVEQLSGR